jgi:hypothetical protein
MRSAKTLESVGSASDYIKRKRARVIDADAEAGQLPKENEWGETFGFVCTVGRLFCLGGDASVSSTGVELV